MKKMILAMLLLAFSGVGFAETPKIIDPPRPTQEFKYLLAITYKRDFAAQIANTEYVYTDSFRIEYFKNKYVGAEGYELVLDFSSQSCLPGFRGRIGSFEVFQDQMCIDLKPGTSLPLHYVNFSDFKKLESLLISPAPKPRTINRAEVKDIPEPQKAKVVFTK